MMTERAPDQDEPVPLSPDAPPGASTGEAQPAYFDQALFDLHYHLLAVRMQGLPPVPNPEDYGVTVDRNGNVTRTDAPPPAQS
jgi:hypothetical protein